MSLCMTDIGPNGKGHRNDGDSIEMSHGHPTDAHKLRTRQTIFNNAKNKYSCLFHE